MYLLGSVLTFITRETARTGALPAGARALVVAVFLVAVAAGHGRTARGRARGAVVRERVARRCGVVEEQALLGGRVVSEVGAGGLCRGLLVAEVAAVADGVGRGAATVNASSS